MTTAADLRSIPGGDALIEWFSDVPHFHDAELLELSISGKGVGSLRIHTWTMTDRTDEAGYFVLENHAVVNFHLEQVKEINCSDVDMIPAVIYRLTISRSEALIRIEWDSSYGARGFISANDASISFLPGKPD